MIDWLNTIDTQVFLALNGLHAPYFDAFMKLFTGKWIWVPMYAAVLFAVVRNYRWRQTLAVLVCVALAITIADQVCATLIRPEVCRLRPSRIHCRRWCILSGVIEAVPTASRRVTQPIRSLLPHF